MVVTPQALSRLKLAALMAAFIGPVLVAVAVYLNPGAWAPPASSHGEIIEPVIVLDEFRAEVVGGAAAAASADAGDAVGASDVGNVGGVAADAAAAGAGDAGAVAGAAAGADAGALDAGFFRGHWTLLLWGGADCGLDCEAGLFKMRQARLALGRHRGRVRTAYLLPPGEPLDIRPPQLLRRHPRLAVARLGGDARIVRALSALAPARVYIVDPHGNLMMGYAADATARGITRDLKHLLRASRIG
ncbi:MAG: hypothetical protein OXU83_07085 [Gammaproteobacteria bacterium]|nr:hypothetical protein [Gammaproteobacteria bacterium]